MIECHCVSVFAITRVSFWTGSTKINQHKINNNNKTFYSILIPIPSSVVRIAATSSTSSSYSTSENDHLGKSRFPV